MLIAITGAAWLALTAPAPSNHVLRVQETVTVQVQPFKRALFGPAAKECAARIAKDMPNVKLLGPFALAARNRNQTMVKLLSIPPDDLIAVMALAETTPMFGPPMKRSVGCSFNITNNGLVFRSLENQRAVVLRNPSRK